MPLPPESVTYRGITMKVVNTREHIRRHIFSPDQTTYLYTQWTYDFDCRYNPAATSYVQFAPNDLDFANITIAERQGEMPAITDLVLRKFLAQPRGLLIVNPARGGEILRSPETGFTVDCKNGPIVEECSIVQVLGQRQFVIRLRVTTWIRECPHPPASTFATLWTQEGGATGFGEGLGPVDLNAINPLISNRYTRRVDIDADHYTMITTEGEAIFRTDFMRATLITADADTIYPDAFRRDLRHDIPDNFQRENIQVEALSDGTGVRYSFVDREKPFNFGRNCPATRIEAYATAWQGEVGWVESALEAVPEAARMMAEETIPWRIPIRLVAIGTGAAVRALPKFYLRVFCRAWGNRDCTRQQLTDLAVGMVVNYLGPVLGRSQEFLVSHDLNGKFVEADCTISWSFIVGVTADAINFVLARLGATAPANVPTSLANIVAGMNRSEVIRVGNVLNLNNNSAVGNPEPPNSDNTRGTAFIAVIANILQDPCQAPTCRNEAPYFDAGLCE